MLISLTDLEINGMGGDMNFTHLTYVATLPHPQKTQNTQNIILKWDIMEDNSIKCIKASSKRTKGIHLTYSLTTVLWIGHHRCH